MGGHKLCHIALLFGEAVISMVSKSSCDNEVSLQSRDEGMMKANYSEAKKNFIII